MILVENHSLLRGHKQGAAFAGLCLVLLPFGPVDHGWDNFLEDHNIFIGERSLGVIHVMLCQFGVLIRYTELDASLLIDYFILSVGPLKFVLQGMKALIEDFGGLRGDFFFVISDVGLSQ